MGVLAAEVDESHHAPVSGPRVIGTPAAGAGFTYTVPGSETQRVVGVSFQLVTAAGGGSRIPRVEYLDTNGSVFFSSASPFTLGGGITAQLSAGIGIVQFGANNAAQIGWALPPFVLVSGLAVRVAITAVAAGDQISGAYLFLDQWPLRP